MHELVSSSVSDIRMLTVCLILGQLCLELCVIAKGSAMPEDSQMNTEMLAAFLNEAEGLADLRSLGLSSWFWSYCSCAATS